MDEKLDEHMEDVDTRISDLDSKIEMFNNCIVKKPIRGSKYDIGESSVEQGLYKMDGSFLESETYDSKIYNLGEGVSLEIVVKRVHLSDYIHVAYRTENGSFVPLVNWGQKKLDSFYLTTTRDMKDLIVSGCDVYGIKDDVAVKDDVFIDKSDIYGYETREISSVSTASSLTLWFLENPVKYDGHITSIFLPRTDIVDSGIYILIGEKISEDKILVISNTYHKISSNNNVLSGEIAFKRGQYIGFVSEERIVGVIRTGEKKYSCYDLSAESFSNFVGLTAEKNDLNIDFAISYDVVYEVSLKELTQTAMVQKRINRNLVNVGHSIWWLDSTTYTDKNSVDGEGVRCKGYQTLLQEQFTFESITKYCYSGSSLGLGNNESSCIMKINAPDWNVVYNAIWTLDTITNDYGRNVPIGTTADFDDNTGYNTYYGALRAFKERVNELSPNAIVVCSNALFRKSNTNGLGLNLEDYEKALCYAATKSGWYFVDQFRVGINEINSDSTLYDGLHPTNFGFRLAIKPWIEQFRNLKSILEKHTCDR